jgi:ssDNA-binding replication factor A large subunit
MTHQPNPKLQLTIRATNGLPWATDHFHADAKVEHVTEVAVKHFVKEKAMTPGEYELVLVVDGTAQPPLAPTEELKDAGVESGSLLALVSAEPHVDG